MNLHCVGDITYWYSIVGQRSLSIFCHHTFQKQSSLSQFEIMTSNGRLKLSIPTKKNTRRRELKHVQIDYSSNWQIEMCRSIQNAYSKSPFYLFYGYKIEAILLQNYDYLFQLNQAMLEYILTVLHHNVPVKYDWDTPVYFNRLNPNEHSPYPQVFDDRFAFENNLSIIDVLFNLGPETKDYLLNL